MGISYIATCRKCQTRFRASEHGGVNFHLLHCDNCGAEKTVSHKDLGKIHLKFIKGLPIPYSSASAKFDTFIQKFYPVASIGEKEYFHAIEEYAGKCICGGKYSMKAGPRCPQCNSPEIDKHNCDIGYMLYD